MISIYLDALNEFYQPDANMRHWLAGEPSAPYANNPGPDGYRVSMTRQIQEISGAGWDTAIYRDNERERDELRFATSRLFATPAAANAWANLWTRLDPALWPHPLQGNIGKRFYEGGTWTDEILVNAVMQKPVVTFNGRTINLEYQIKFEHSEPGQTGTTTFLVADDSLAASVWLVDDNGVLLVADTLT